MACIFDQQDFSIVSNSGQLFHVADLAVQMHRQCRFDFQPRLLCTLHRIQQRRLGKQSGVRVDISKHNVGAGHAHDIGCGQKRRGRHNGRVAGADVTTENRQV